MNRLMRIAIALCGTSAVLLACGASRVDLVKAHIATVTAVPSDQKEFYAVYAEQLGDELLIFGKLNSKPSTVSLPGQVDAAIVGGDGNLLSTFSMPIQKHGKKRPGWYGAHFRARIPLVVPKGAAIRLAFHPHGHPGRNFALPN